MFSPDPEVAKRQMLTVVYLLTAFGHMDGKFGMAEMRFVQEKIAALVEQHLLETVSDPLARHVATDRATEQVQRVAATIHKQIMALFSESVAEGESQEQFIRAKIALRCYELLVPFDEEAQAELFESVDELIMADGVAHPEEEKLRDDLKRLLAEPIEITEFEVLDDDAAAIIELLDEVTLVPRVEDHPFFTRLERPYPSEPEGFEPLAVSDLELVRKVRETLRQKREAGAGRLDGVQSFPELSGQAPFLDGHVYVLPPDPEKDYELIVLGDLHGCYSCLKGALMQSDFLAKVQAHVDDPENAPDTRLVLLGDYIDRGRFSYDGVLRAIMQLYVTVPDSVYMLRGNHEYYLEHEGRVLAPVRPAEGMMNLKGVAGDGFFREYMQLFEELPTVLAFERLLFAHAGIPRDATMREKWKDLSSLSHPDIRFEMMWSDPSDTDTVPDELQQAAARFGYGTSQFRSFMAKIGCSALIRGHERITKGFETVYDYPDASLYTLFSAGGAECQDLPETSNYREVSPRALTIRWRDGVSTITPFEIDWARYNDVEHNGLLG